MLIDKDGEFLEPSNHWEILESGNIIVSNSPESLWDNAVSYFRWCDEHPIVNRKSIYSGKDTGGSYKESLVRPYTIKGLCIHCGINEEYLSDIKRNKAPDSLYYAVICRIEYVIHTQNLENAMVGLFNPILTAKVLSIDDGSEVKEEPVVVNIIGELPQLAKSESEITIPGK